VPYYPDQGADELYVAVAQVRDSANLDAGIPHLREAIQRFKPQQPEFYLELARAFSKSGNAAQAVPWCEQALRLRPGFEPAQIELGAALITAGGFTRAATALRGLRGTRAQTNLANAYRRLGRIDLAEQTLRPLTADPDANNLLGMVESARSNYRAAEQCFRKVLELQTDHAEAHQNLANLLASQRDYPQAAYHFRQAIASNPAFTEAHYRLGLLLLATGAIDCAQTEIQEVLRISPGLAERYRDLADILAAKGRVHEAAAEYRLAEKGAR
jgi:tetratricopeptide (TPR) repeat protein